MHCSSTPSEVRGGLPGLEPPGAADCPNPVPVSAPAHTNVLSCGQALDAFLQTEISVG